MGDTQGMGDNAPEKIHTGDLTEFKRMVSEGASIHFAALAAGMEAGWERDEQLRGDIDRLNARNVCEIEAYVVKHMKSGGGGTTMAANYLKAKAGWNEKDDLAQEIVILPKVVDGRLALERAASDKQKSAL